MDKLDIFKAYTIKLLDHFNFFELSEEFFYKKNETNVFTKDTIYNIESWQEACSFCDKINTNIWPIFRTEYGRDRKNDGEGLKQKVEPFLLKFRNLSSRVQELRIEEMKQNGTYSF